MSYSFNVKAATKAEVLEQAKAKMAEVVQAQPIHARDQEQAIATSETMLGLIADPADGEEVSVYVSGTLGWRGDMAAPEAIISAGVNVSVSVHTKQ